MSVAVYSGEPLLARMLLLEAKRCGLREAKAREARVWLVDLDHPVPLPKGDGAPMQIGFTAHPEALDSDTRLGLYAVLRLPFCAQELDALLYQQEAPARALVRNGEELWLSGKKLKFSKTEQQLLSHLLAHRDRAVTQEELASILGESAENSNATAVYLYRLRRKLEADGITRIRTVRGVGYQWIGD